MSDLLIKNAKVVTFDPDAPFYECADILIRDGKIECIDPDGIDDSDVKTLELGENFVVFPGFINAHNHLYSALARGITLKTDPSQNFTAILEDLWWRLDKALDQESVYYSAMVGYIDALSAGTTTIIDHHCSPNAITGSLNTLAKASKEVGLRSCLCYEVSDRDGKERAFEGIEENASFIAENKNEFLSGLFGLHASFTLEQDTLEKVSEKVNELQAGVHIHMCEDKADLKHCLETYSCSPLQRMNQLNLVNDQSIFSHCLHLLPEDYSILRESNANVIHNPRSNMNNAVGALDLQKMLEEDVLVGLGSDGMASNILPELSSAIWLQKHQSQRPEFGFMEGLNLLVEKNAQIVQKCWGINVGKIQPGAFGDFAIFEYDSPTPLHENNWAGHLVFALSLQKVYYTICHGRIVYENGTVPGLDVSEIYKQSRKVAAQLWEKY